MGSEYRDRFALSDRRDRTRDQQPSSDHETTTGRTATLLIRGELERSARGGGGAVVASCSKFDPPIDDAKIQPVDQAAIAALLAKILHSRPRPFAIRDDVIID